MSQQLFSGAQCSELPADWPTDWQTIHPPATVFRFLEPNRKKKYYWSKYLMKIIIQKCWFPWIVYLLIPITLLACFFLLLLLLLLLLFLVFKLIVHNPFIHLFGSSVLYRAEFIRLSSWFCFLILIMSQIKYSNHLYAPSSVLPSELVGRCMLTSFSFWSCWTDRFRIKVRKKSPKSGFRN